MIFIPLSLLSIILTMVMWVAASGLGRVLCKILVKQLHWCTVCHDITELLKTILNTIQSIHQNRRGNYEQNRFFHLSTSLTLHLSWLSGPEAPSLFLSVFSPGLYGCLQLFGTLGCSFLVQTAPAQVPYQAILPVKEYQHITTQS